MRGVDVGGRPSAGCGVLAPEGCVAAFVAGCYQEVGCVGAVAGGGSVLDADGHEHSGADTLGRREGGDAGVGG